MNNREYPLLQTAARKPVPATNGAGYDWRDRPTYDGKELRPFEGRPGAMDAYALSSRGVG